MSHLLFCGYFSGEGEGLEICVWMYVCMDVSLFIFFVTNQANKKLTRNSAFVRGKLETSPVGLFFLFGVVLACVCVLRVFF